MYTWVLLNTSEVELKEIKWQQKYNFSFLKEIYRQFIQIYYRIVISALFFGRYFDLNQRTVRLVREAEVILLTFSRGKSILLLNCSLDVQQNNSECCLI